MRGQAFVVKQVQQQHPIGHQFLLIKQTYDAAAPKQGLHGFQVFFAHEFIGQALCAFQVQGQRGRQVGDGEFALDKASRVECGAGIHDRAPPTTSA